MNTDHRLYYVCKELETPNSKYDFYEPNAHKTDCFLENSKKHDFYEPNAHKTDCFLENSKKHECRPIGNISNLKFFKEEANIKHICKHIPADLRKTVFELKYPDSTVISPFSNQ